MEIKKPTIKSIPYEDFKDNEYLENMVKQLNEGGTKVLVGCLDDLINWGRSNSLWPLTFATSCCGIEFMAVGAARYDFARFGFEVAGMIQLQRKVKLEKFFGGVNRKEKEPQNPEQA